MKFGLVAHPDIERAVDVGKQVLAHLEEQCTGPGCEVLVEESAVAKIGGKPASCGELVSRAYSSWSPDVSGSRP